MYRVDEIDGEGEGEGEGEDVGSESASLAPLSRSGRRRDRLAATSSSVEDDGGGGGAGGASVATTCSRSSLSSRASSSASSGNSETLSLFSSSPTRNLASSLKMLRRLQKGAVGSAQERDAPTVMSDPAPRGRGGGASSACGEPRLRGRHRSHSSTVSPRRGALPLRPSSPPSALRHSSKTSAAVAVVAAERGQQAGGDKRPNGGVPRTHRRRLSATLLRSRPSPPVNAAGTTPCRRKSRSTSWAPGERRRGVPPDDVTLAAAEVCIQFDDADDAAATSSIGGTTTTEVATSSDKTLLSSHSAVTVRVSNKDTSLSSATIVAEQADVTTTSQRGDAVSPPPHSNMLQVRSCAVAVPGEIDFSFGTEEATCSALHSDDDNRDTPSASDMFSSQFVVQNTATGGRQVRERMDLGISSGLPLALLPMGSKPPALATKGRGISPSTSQPKTVEMNGFGEREGAPSHSPVEDVTDSMRVLGPGGRGGCHTEHGSGRTAKMASTSERRGGAESSLPPPGSERGGSHPRRGDVDGNRVAGAGKREQVKRPRQQPATEILPTMRQRTAPAPAPASRGPERRSPKKASPPPGQASKLDSDAKMLLLELDKDSDLVGGALPMESPELHLRKLSLSPPIHKGAPEEFQHHFHGNFEAKESSGIQAKEETVNGDNISSKLKKAVSLGTLQAVLLNRHTTASERLVNLGRKSKSFHPRLKGRSTYSKLPHPTPLPGRSGLRRSPPVGKSALQWSDLGDMEHSRKLLLPKCESDTVSSSASEGLQEAMMEQEFPCT